MSWIDGWRFGPRPKDVALDVTEIDLGSAYVTLDRDDDGEVTAVLIGAGKQVVRLSLADRSSDHGWAVLLDVGIVCRRMFESLTGYPAATGQHVPCGPNTFGSPEPDTDGII